MLEQTIFHPDSQFHCAYITEMNAVTATHRHDFYEIFLIIRGEIVHNVGGARFEMAAGDLALIRPDDEHCYERKGASSCLFVNLAFTRALALDAFRYLDHGFESGLLALPEPPRAHAPQETVDRAAAMLRQASALPSKADESRSALLKSLLFELLTLFLRPADDGAEPTQPLWLRELCERMRSLDEFAAGVPAMQALAGCTPEHLARSFRKYLGTTPTQYVNDLRLNYIKNMLEDTDLGVTEICVAAGYNSLSHANHLFREKYGMAPTAYRAANRKVVIP